jgi:hypothetical protein
MMLEIIGSIIVYASVAVFVVAVVIGIFGD